MEDVLVTNEDKLESYAARIEGLMFLDDEDERTIINSILDVYDEARDNGFDERAVNKALSARFRGE